LRRRVKAAGLVRHGMDAMAATGGARKDNGATVLAQKLYEAMFVVDAAKGGSEFPATIRHIADLIRRHDAEIERIEKWEERKFAYPIKGIKRGIYVLVFFRAEGSVIAEMRRLIGLSEVVLRVLILKANELSEVKGQLYTAEGEETAGTPAPAPAPAESVPSPAEAATEVPAAQAPEEAPEA
jgi:ribosomal protein S6